MISSDGAEPAGMVLAQASRDGRPPVPWLVANGRALPLHEWGERFAGLGSVTELVQHWREHEADLRALTARPQVVASIIDRGDPVHTLRLDTPIRPRQIFCTIGNYHRQVAEAASDAGDTAGAPERRANALEALRQRSRTGEPYICLTSPERIGAPTGTLLIAPDVDTLDWEVEIAVVVGTTARRVAESATADLVAGYCVANDLTVRSRVARPDLPALGSDWIRSKGMPGSLPLGPYFVPVWQVPDPLRLRLQLSVNGVLMQDDTADDMVFGIERQLAYLSQHTQLQSGDVVCTGSPAGFGARHGRFLHPGDVVRARVSGLGEQQLVCREDTTPSPVERQRTSHTELMS